MQDTDNSSGGQVAHINPKPKSKLPEGLLDPNGDHISHDSEVTTTVKIGKKKLKQAIKRTAVL